MAVIVPLWVVAVPLLAIVCVMAYIIGEMVLDFLHPKVMGLIIRRYEKKTGFKWNPDEERFEE